MKIPFVTSHLPTIAHPQINEIANDTKKYFRTDAFKIATENAQLYADYIGAGALYSSYIYPLGDLEKVKAISRYYSYWALLDDHFFDNALDLDHIIRMAKEFRAALDEAPGVDKLFHPVIEFCSRADWTSETKDIFRHEMNRYLNSVIRLRTIEVRKNEITLEEYLKYRAFDVAMPVIFSLLWYTQDDMPLSSYHSAEFEKAFAYSGMSIGVLLDLYTLHARKHEIKHYTHSIRIIKRVENCDEEEAISRGFALFYEYERKVEDELDRLADVYPKAVQYFKYTQSGTIRYCNESRKIRYLQDYDPDENLVPGRTIL